MTLPNFLVIGAQKAGTTSLYHYLDQHPQIFMSPVKEPGFFALENKEINFCGPGDSQEYRYVVNDLSSYKKLFEGKANEIAIGEATTWYLYSPLAPKLIKDYVPKAKLIAVLRNPVDRAYSAFMHATRDGYEEVSDFGQALEKEDWRIQNNWGYLWHYKHMGFYASQIKRYLNYFDRNQLKVYLYEDLDNNPIDLLNNIYDFLNVNKTFIPEVFTRLNVSGVRKSKALDTLLDETNPIKKFLKPLIPSGLRKYLANKARIQNYTKLEYPPVIRNELVKIFHEDILELQDIIQRDLSKWLK